MHDRLFKNKYRIKSTRLPGYDYGSPGWYFVTICTKNREHYFGHIENGKMVYTEIGEIADKFWWEIPDHFPHVKIDEYIIMPDHMHGIIEITHAVDGAVSDTTISLDTAVSAGVAVGTVSSGALVMPVSSATGGVETQCDWVETQNFASLPVNDATIPPGNKFGPQSRNLPSIIRGYKSAVKKHATMNNIPFAWQSRYYDHIIRDEISLYNIREYIKLNPEKWHTNNE